jgi:hypothetical protein
VSEVVGFKDMGFPTSYRQTKREAPVFVSQLAKSTSSSVDNFGAVSSLYCQTNPTFNPVFLRKNTP